MSVVHGLALFGIPGFVLGVYVGWVSEARKGQYMKLSTSLRAWFDRWLPVLYLAIAVPALVGIVIAASASITNGRQDARARAENAARDQVTAQLLHCFDDFASQLAGSLPPVRAASAKRDDATAERDHALQSLIAIIATGVQNDINGEVPSAAQEEARQRVFADALGRLVKAGDSLDDAQAALDRARQRNPYPDPPSTFCAVDLGDVPPPSS